MGGRHATGEPSSTTGTDPGKPVPPGVSVFVVAGTPPPAAVDLRRDVFVYEQGVPAELELDGRDAGADHAIVLDTDGRALATARLLDSEDPAAPAAGEPHGTIGRVAVRADQRGRGLGLVVMEALEQRAGERGLPTVVLHAQAAVEAFYLRQGYSSEDDRFLEAGIEHVAMRKDLLPGLRPVRDTDSAALIRLIDATWSEYQGCVLDVDAEEPWLRAPAAAYAPGTGYDGAMWVLPAPDSGDLLACVAVRQAGPSAVELKSLYVGVGARRLGLGAALVHRAEREARRRRASRVELWTDTRFTDAHRLYGRLGYTRTGRSRTLDDLSRTTEYEFVLQIPRYIDAEN